jgi:hypothetical protein
VPPKKITTDTGSQALEAWLAGEREPQLVALAVRYSLQLLATRAPGKSVEVRVPPFGATQCLAGLEHRRGTPPNVVETDPETWLALALGKLDWQQGLASGKLLASGSRTGEVAGELPLTVFN